MEEYEKVIQKQREYRNEGIRVTTIFMNSENNKAYSLHSLLLNIQHEIDIRREAQARKCHTKAISSIYWNKHWTQNLGYLMGPVLYQIFTLILSASSRSMRRWQPTHHYKYISTDLRIKLHSRLRLDTIARFLRMK